MYRRPAPPPNLDALQAQFETALGPDELARLSAILDGVPTDALKAIGYGWDAAKKAFTAPFFDAEGHLAGIACRAASDGRKKWMIKGSKPGVAVVDEWLARPGPLLLPEGHTDAATSGAAGARGLARQPAGA